MICIPWSRYREPSCSALGSHAICRNRPMHHTQRQMACEVTASTAAATHPGQAYPRRPLVCHKPSVRTVLLADVFEACISEMSFACRSLIGAHSTSSCGLPVHNLPTQTKYTVRAFSCFIAAFRCFFQNDFCSHHQANLSIKKACRTWSQASAD